MNQRIFVTYHPANREFALQLAQTLQSHAVPVMVDEWSFRPGADRDDSFLAAMKDCTHLLVVLSPEASASREIDSHIYHALQNNRYVLPIIHQRCEIPLRIRGRENVDFLTLGHKDAQAKLLRLFGKKFREPGKGRREVFKSCGWVTVGIVLALTALFCLIFFLASLSGY